MVSRSPFAHQKDRDHKPRHSSQAAADATPSAARAHTSIIVWYKYETGTWPRKYTRLPLSSKCWLSVSAIVRVEDLEFEGGERNSRSGVRVLSNDLTELAWCVRACKLYLGLCIALGPRF